MHGIDRPLSRPLPPKAQRTPKFSVHHGVELVDEYAWLRAKADADNIRKRAQAEAAAAQKYALERFAEGLLPVLDSLEAAVVIAQEMPAGPGARIEVREMANARM